jgi:hypothetical protein
VAPAGTPGSLPIADGFADVAQAGLTLQPGVNNFRVFVLGNGPDVRGTLVGSTVSNTLQLDLQVDYTIYSGLAVDEESKVYVVSGGTPAGIGLNPSPSRGEVLLFPDKQPFDRRADYIDLRGDVLPNPPNPSNNVGDGQAERFDYLYYQAPIDQVSLTPAGLSGLARGFLLYMNRTRNDPALFPTLPNGRPLGNDDHAGPLFFESFDASHQIAGGDDQTFPFHGDDSDGGGSPSIAGPLMGGFEFIYRELVTSTNSLAPTAWNAFFLNSNGSLTFGGGDDTPAPTVPGFLSGLPRVAGAWADLNPGSRWQSGFTNTFPLQAMGFAGINHFVVRWINVPSAGQEFCDSSNSFTVSLYDDGTGVDENANQPLNPANPVGNNAVPFDRKEGPTDLHFVKGITSTLAGFSPRPDGSGNLCLTYGRMDLLGDPISGTETLVGATPGHLSSLAAPGVNLSRLARMNDLPFPTPLGVAMGPGSPANQFLPSAPFEFFNTGARGTFTVTGGITVTTPARPTFDLRQEGNDAALSTPVNQPDLNRGQVCFYIVNSALFFPIVLR